MPLFAVLNEDNFVVNVIVAESLADAEPAGFLVLELEDVYEASIGYERVNGSWKSPEPKHPGWIWDETHWVAPILVPNDGKEYEWSRIENNWVEVNERVLLPNPSL